MRISQAVIAALAAALTGIGGGVAAAQAQRDHHEPTSRPPSTSSPAVVDRLSEENVVHERLYFDVTGHSFTRVDPDPAPVLGPCTGDTTFTDVLPGRGASRISSKLVGGGGRHVVSQLAQTGSRRAARAAADKIVSLVDDCVAISGGDFGYGDPVTVPSGARRKIVYFPAYDSDTAAGGYIVFSVGRRVGVIEVADGLTVEPVAHLAIEAATIAAI